MIKQWRALLLLSVLLVSSSSLVSAREQPSGLKHLELDDLRKSQRSLPLPSTADKTGSPAPQPGKLVKRATSNNVTSGTKQQQPAANGKRPSRQQTAAKPPPPPRPGFFWTLASVTYETFNDTRSAIQQIGDILNNSLAPETPKKPPPKKKPPVSKQPLTTSPAKGSSTPTTTPAPETTTEFKLTRPLLQSLVRRNVKGLVRLFGIEWRDAMQQSKKNVADFQRDLGKSVGVFLQDNPKLG